MTDFAKRVFMGSGPTTYSFRNIAAYAMLSALIACGQGGQAQEPETAKRDDSSGTQLQGPRPTRENRLAATAPAYTTPPDSRTECLGRYMFDVRDSVRMEWAIPSKNSGKGVFDDLFPYFDNGTGKGYIEIKTKELHTVFSVFGPDTPELREKFLGYRTRMNEATLSGLLSSLEQQNENEAVYQKNPELLGPGIKEHLAKERAELEKDVAEIKADRYRKAIDLHRPDSAAFRHDRRRNGSSYLRGAIVLGKHLVAFESMLTADVPDSTDPTEAQWQEAENALRRLIGQLQPRELYEIPKERGFCLPYAFLRDDGTLGNDISASFRLADSPAVIYTLKFAAIPAGGPSETTLINATGRSATGLLSQLPQDTKVKQRLGPRSVKIGALTSEQGGIVVEAKRPGKPVIEGYYVYTGNGGWSGSQILPTIEVEMESAARQAYPQLTADAPPYEQARPRLDALLKSIRLRPTTPPMPEMEGVK